MDDFVKGGSVRGKKGDRIWWDSGLFEDGMKERDKFMVEKVVGDIVEGGEFDSLEWGMELGIVGDDD